MLLGLQTACSLIVLSFLQSPGATVISNRQIFKFSKKKNLCSLFFRRPNSVGAFRLFPATGRIFTKAAVRHITLTKDRTALYK